MASSVSTAATRAASAVKEDSSCHVDVVSVGNVKLFPYTEQVASFPQPHATAKLAVDVLSSPQYTSVSFNDVTLTLEIVNPDGTPTSGNTKFVGFYNAPNVYWGIPSGTGWDESRYGVATAKLRLRQPQGVLLSPHTGDGLSFWVGVTGLASGARLAFRASASATRVTASADSCAVRIKDLGRGDHIDGVLSYP
ncbi:hypothetical protein ACH5A3_31600 [Streptomyces echinatus]|uniref:hypothetical protein n=1 Tax=Streptomyces echinatus TaxID=67293 RepID=UPI0037B8D0E3